MPVDEEFERTSTFLWTCKRWMHVFGTSASIRASLDVRKDAFQKRVRRIRRISKRDVVGLRVDPEKAFLSFIGSMSNHPFLCVAFRRSVTNHVDAKKTQAARRWNVDFVTSSRASFRNPKRIVSKVSISLPSQRKQKTFLRNAMDANQCKAELGAWSAPS